MGGVSSSDLHSAIEDGDEEKCKEQLEVNKNEEDEEKKWSVDEPDDDGRTPFHHAAHVGHVGIMNVLVAESGRRPSGAAS